MKKLPSWTLTILLLILIAAGWLVYKSRVNNVAPFAEPPARPTAPMDKTMKLNGKVIEYGSNAEGDIDKMLLATDQENKWIHFPPHIARSVTASAAINSVIEVIVNQGGPGVHNHPDAALELKHLKNPPSHAIIDLTEIPPPPPRKGFEVEVQGRAKDLKSLREMGNSFILSGKLISVPPHMAPELFPLVWQAKMILVKGFMRDSTEGFQSASGLPVVKASAIQLDHITYKIR